MISTIKAELRKLLSVRSTYILIAAALALISLFNYFGTSSASYEEAVCTSTGEVLYSRDYTDKRLEGASPEAVCGGEVRYMTKTVNDLPDDKLLFNLQETVPIIALFVAVIVVLLMAHEFRYSTINYTLTISNSRSKVLLSKLLVSIGLIVGVTLLAISVSVVVTQLAVHVKHLNLPAESYNWPYILFRHVSYTLIYVLFFLGIATMVRNLAAGIVAILLVPMLDGIAGLLLAARNIEPTKILPFSALERFGSVATDVSSTEIVGEFVAQTSSGRATVVLAGMVALAYLVGLWIVTWLLFLRRDAN